MVNLECRSHATKEKCTILGMPPLKVATNVEALMDHLEVEEVGLARPKLVHYTEPKLGRIASEASHPLLSFNHSLIRAIFDREEDAVEVFSTCADNQVLVFGGSILGKVVGEHAHVYWKQIIGWH